MLIIPTTTVNSKFLFINPTIIVGTRAKISISLPNIENLLSTVKASTAINDDKIDIGIYFRNSSSLGCNFILDIIVIGSILGITVTTAPNNITTHMYS